MSCVGLYIKLIKQNKRGGCTLVLVPLHADDGHGTENVLNYWTTTSRTCFFLKQCVGVIKWNLQINQVKRQHVFVEVFKNVMLCG